MNRYPYLRIKVGIDEVELASDRLLQAGAQAIEEQDESTLISPNDESIHLIAAFESEDAAMAAQKKLAGRYCCELNFLEGDEWRYRWREYFGAADVSDRLFLRPSWDTKICPEGMIEIVIDPGGAFGSGIHETTRLCLQGLDKHLEAGETVLDAGCGSGILAIGAKKLGAARTVAFDIAVDSIPIAKENALRNDTLFECFSGTIGDIAEPFDFVLANMQTHILLPIGDRLQEVSKRALLLSGVLVRDAEKVTAAFEKGVFSLEERQEEGPWCSLYFTRDALRN